MKENADRSSDIPVADLAAEATNDGSPAQSISEAIPPRDRPGYEKPNKGQNRLPSNPEKPLRDPKR